MNQTRFDFNAWLDVKPDDETYNYINCTGNCAVGQFMKEKLGEEWNMNRYAKLASEICGTTNHAALADSRTFGELKARLRELDFEPA